MIYKFLYIGEWFHDGCIIIFIYCVLGLSQNQFVFCVQVVKDLLNCGDCGRIIWARMFLKDFLLLLLLLVAPEAYGCRRFSPHFTVLVAATFKF